MKSSKHLPNQFLIKNDLKNQLEKVPQKNRKKLFAEIVVEIKKAQDDNYV